MANSPLRYKVEFEEIYIFYYSRMKRFAKEYVIHEEDAENIVQDIFIDLWEKKFVLPSLKNLSGFLFIMLKNRCIDFIRRKTIEKQILNKMQEEYILSIKLKSESLQLLDDELLNDPNIDTLIQNAIADLPEKCRNILVMNKLEGKKQKAIAEELNISIHTVESQMAIAYRKLKETLKDYFPLLLLFYV